MKTTKYANLALGLMLTQPVTLLMAQQQPPQWESNPSAQPPAQQFNQQQLAALVAPIALYPDALLSQILVAATYPMELQQAGQWLQSSGNLSGPDLVAAAGQQPWDASVQALVVFPDVVSRMTSNMKWTTDLGNAFLTQQGDVMNAVQSLRAQAQASGRLASTPQQNVIDQGQGSENMIEIQPADPETVYVPDYNPEYIWGAPAYGYAYPSLYYRHAGFGFGYGVSIGRFFGGGLGWRSWGWRPNWHGHRIIQNNSFFSRYRFNGHSNRGHYGSGSAVWAHNPAHRMGVPYRSGGSHWNTTGRSFGGGTRYQQAVPRHNNGGYGRGYTSPEHRSAPNAGTRHQQSPNPFSGGNRGSYGGHQAAPGRSFSHGNSGDRGRSTPSFRQRSSPSQGHQASPRNFGGGHQNSHQASPRSHTSSGGSRPTPSSRQQSHSSGGNGGHRRGK